MSNYQRGEELSIQCLLKNGYQVIDRRNDKEYWRKDIDLTVCKDNQQIDIEVKWDAKIGTSGSMFLELLTNIQDNKLGWAQYTQADYIFYGDSQKMLFYVFSVPDMRRYLKEHKGEYETRVANDYNYYDGSIKKQSLGAVVPIGLFKQHVHVQVIDIAERLHAEMPHISKIIG